MFQKTLSWVNLAVKMEGCLAFQIRFQTLVGFLAVIVPLGVYVEHAPVAGAFREGVFFRVFGLWHGFSPDYLFLGFGCAGSSPAGFSV